MTVFLSIIWFLIVISVIVIVHEFGHFLFAKLFKTKVEEFAIGFGPAIFKIAGKETLFRFNCIPLGGYVRLGGEEIFDEEDKKDDPSLFYNKKPWQKLLITAAGPIFSFLLGYFIFIGIAGLYGFPQVVIGDVNPGSPAEIAGLMPGDIIRKVNGKYVFNQGILSMEITSGDPLELTVIRNNEKIVTNVVPVLVGERAVFMLNNVANLEQLHIQEEEILSINGERDIFSVMKLMEVGDPIEIELKDGQILKGNLTYFSYTPPTYIIGITYTYFSNEIKQDLEYFKKGDKIVSINGVLIEKPVDLEKFITSIQLNSDELIFSVTENFIDNAYRPIFNDILHVEIERNNELIEIQISKADFLNDISKPGALVSAYPNWKPKGVDFLSVPIHWANYLIKLTFQSLGQLFTGQLSSDDVMGVVGLTVVIGEAAKFGLEAILELMALITISLGAFNLIPIPGLDGGRIIFSIYEMIARKPVSPKVEAIINTIGFLFLILLIVFVTYNDIVRFF
ncbi:MAG TPA: site-2 protease family protein [Defluviitoga tunisiensis]|nr:site-2 protease family protein [Defluviitoga tunisiensis]